MSVTTEQKVAAAPYDDDTPVENVTYTFKITEENRENMALVAMSEGAKDSIVELVMRSGKWRSVSQFVNDALTFYLNSDSAEMTIGEVEEMVERDYDHKVAGCITQTLWEEIDMLVNHAHTEWSDKQQFYSCALVAYDNAGFPIVERK